MAGIRMNNVKNVEFELEFEFYQKLINPYFTEYIEFEFYYKNIKLNIESLCYFIIDQQLINSRATSN